MAGSKNPCMLPRKASLQLTTMSVSDWDPIAQSGQSRRDIITAVIRLQTGKKIKLNSETISTVVGQALMYPLYFCIYIVSVGHKGVGGGGVSNKITNFSHKKWRLQDY